eukprot:14060-Chlamydomonas_euryale.AAC.2
MATLIVKCYPVVPDALGIASALGSDLGEPDSSHTRQLTMRLGGYLDDGDGAALGVSAIGGLVMGGAMGTGVGGGRGVGTGGTVGLGLNIGADVSPPPDAQSSGGGRS